MLSSVVDAVRYYLALVVVMTLPPGVLLWYAIHPFARFWRRFGVKWTYAILAAPTFGLMAVPFFWRDRLFSVEYGSNGPVAIVGVACLVVGVVVAVKRKKYLTFAMKSLFSLTCIRSANRAMNP